MIETLKDRVNGDAGLVQATPIACQALPRDEQGTRAGKERDPPMTETDQRGHHGGDPRGIVDADVRLAECVRRQVNDRRAVGLLRHPPRLDRQGVAAEGQFHSFHFFSALHSPPAGARAPPGTGGAGGGERLRTGRAAPGPGAGSGYLRMPSLPIRTR